MAELVKRAEKGLNSGAFNAAARANGGWPWQRDAAMPAPAAAH
ncbi:hypothetical protein [Thermoproteus tenax]|nr:hypothetical protein [Thermoproteus tenax]